MTGSQAAFEEMSFLDRLVPLRRLDFKPDATLAPNVMGYTAKTTDVTAPGEPEYEVRVSISSPTNDEKDAFLTFLSDLRVGFLLTTPFPVEDGSTGRVEDESAEPDVESGKDILIEFGLHGLRTHQRGRFGLTIVVRATARGVQAATTANSGGNRYKSMNGELINVTVTPLTGSGTIEAAPPPPRPGTPIIHQTLAAQKRAVTVKGTPLLGYKCAATSNTVQI